MILWQMWGSGTLHLSRSKSPFLFLPSVYCQFFEILCRRATTVSPVAASRFVVCVASFGLIFFACWESGSMRIDILPPCSIFPSRACYCDSRSPFDIERILSVKMSSYGVKTCQKFVKSIQKVWCRPPANVWNKKKQYIVIFSSKLIVEAYENREQRNSRQHAIVAILIKSLMWIIFELQMSTCLFLHDKGSNLNIFTNKYWIIRN